MALEQLPELVYIEVRYFKAGWALLITCVTLVMGQATPSEGWIASVGWLGLPSALGVLHFGTAELINKVFAWCPPAQFHQRQFGTDRTGTRVVYAIAEA